MIKFRRNFDFVESKKKDFCGNPKPMTRYENVALTWIVVGNFM
jgi:hypothetical protein